MADLFFTRAEIWVDLQDAVASKGSDTIGRNDLFGGVLLCLYLLSIFSMRLTTRDLHPTREGLQRDIVRFCGGSSLSGKPTFLHSDTGEGGGGRERGSTLCPGPHVASMATHPTATPVPNSPVD